MEATRLVGSPLELKITKTALFLLWFALLPLNAQVAEEMYFMSGGAVRRACYYKPPGNGPFPVMIYNQATPKPSPENGEPAPFLILAKFYVSNGYVLFLPGRPVLSGPDSDQVTTTKSAEAMEIGEMQLMASHEGHNLNIQSAVEWLKTQSFVDTDQIYMSGHSSGAIQTILLAEKNLGIKGYIAFSPAALLWDKHPKLQEALLSAVKNQTGPIFLIQPQNDFGLQPSVVLGPEIVMKGKPNRAKIFPAYGRAHAEGNGFAFNAPQIWGGDVLEFIKLCSQRTP